MQPVLTSLKLSRTSYLMKKVVGGILNLGLSYVFFKLYMDVGACWAEVHRVTKSWT